MTSLDLPQETRRFDVVPAAAPSNPSSGLPNLAGTIRRLRKRNGLSQRELARRMQVPRTYVSKIENDKATPTLASLERLATAMQMSVAYLLQVTGDGDHRSTQVRDLMSDGFIREILPYVQHLGPLQRNRLLSELQVRTRRMQA